MQKARKRNFQTLKAVKEADGKPWKMLPASTTITILKVAFNRTLTSQHRTSGGVSGSFPSANMSPASCELLLLTGAGSASLVQSAAKLEEHDIASAKDCCHSFFPIPHALSSNSVDCFAHS